MLTLALVALCGFQSMAKETGGKPVMKFSEEVFDFGDIMADGGHVTHYFEFVNIGNGNLVIKDVTAQCGCTRPDYPKNPIPPGKKNKIKVSFDPQRFKGEINKTVTVNSNAGKVVLHIKANVIRKKR